jgi:hypothetical protein
MAMGQIDRKPDPQKNEVGLNLTTKPAPAGENWHPHPNPSGFGCPSGFVNVFLSDFFGFPSDFSSGFSFFSGLVQMPFQGFFGFRGFFEGVSGFRCTRG